MQTRPRPSGGTVVKRPGRHARIDKTFKIKKIINNPKNIDIKYRQHVVEK